MHDPKPIAGARALLFERLVDLHPGTTEERAFRVLDREQLKASVRRELERLLNTRCNIPLRMLSEIERSVINYGLPDFSSLSAQNADDQILIASIIRQTISAFEPRLKQVSVEVDQIEDSESALAVNINAELVIDLLAEPVSFPMLISKNGAAALNDIQ